MFMLVAVGRCTVALWMGVTLAVGLLQEGYWQKHPDTCLGPACASKPSYSHKHSITASTTGFQTPVYPASPTASALLGSFLGCCIHQFLLSRSQEGPGMRSFKASSDVHLHFFHKDLLGKMVLNPGQRPGC